MQTITAGKAFNELNAIMPEPYKLLGDFDESLTVESLKIIKTQIGGVDVEIVDDGTNNNYYHFIAASLVGRLASAEPFKSHRIVIKCNIDNRGEIKIHNLDPSVAVAIASDIAINWGFVSKYDGGYDRFADTLSFMTRRP